MTYQDIIRPDGSVHRGERMCEARWEAIRPLLAEFDRPFTLLDLGASEGYFGFAAAREFECVPVMVESGSGGSDLLSLCRENEDAGAVVLTKHLTVADLERLAECEDFDVVLCMNFLHHLPAEDAERAVEAVLALGEWVVIETPPPGDKGACGQEAIGRLHEILSHRPHHVLGETPSHVSEVMRPLWAFSGEGGEITRPYFDAPDSEHCAAEITSTRKRREVSLPAKGERREWLPGVNLRTYQMLGGAWPPVQRVAALVDSYRLPSETHGDIRPWNFVLDGTNVHLIDGGDEKAIYDDVNSLAVTVEDLRTGPWSADEWAERSRSLRAGFSVVVLTPFRNATRHLDGYFRQVNNLQQTLPVGSSLRVVAAEGDSTDGTREALRRAAREHDVACSVVATDHGGPAWDSIEDPARMASMSKVMNAAFDAVEPSDDIVVWIMSDLEWGSAPLADLIDAASHERGGFDIFAPMVYLDQRFYDTWAYRKDGERFRPEPPYCDGWVPRQLVEVDSAGTCLVMRSEVARDCRATVEEAVSWCAAARASGYRIAVSDRWTVQHATAPNRRLLWVGDAVAPTGFSRCTHAVVPALMAAGWDVEVVGLNYWGVPHGHPYRIWPAAVSTQAPFGELRLRRLLEAGSFDAVVILNDPWNIPQYMAHIEDLDRPPVIGWLAVDGENQNAEAVAELDHLAVWTEFSRQQLTGADLPTTVVPLGVDTSVYRPRDKDEARSVVWPDRLPPDAFIVGTVARNQYRKRHDLLIASFAEFARERDDAYLYLHIMPSRGSAGTDLQRVVHYHGLQGRVIVLESALSDAMLVAYYNALDLYATTSQGEGWGLPVLEAMACGVPVVAPDWSGLGSWARPAARLVRCQETALSAPMNDLMYTVGGVVRPSEFADEMGDLYERADLRANHRSAGLALAREYTWERAAAAMVQLVENVASHADEGADLEATG